MIHPNKHISLKYSFLGAGIRILQELKTPQTVSSLWNSIQKYDEIESFEKYVLILDFLYITEIIEYEKGLIKSTQKSFISEGMCTEPLVNDDSSECLIRNEILAELSYINGICGGTI